MLFCLVLLLPCMVVAQPKANADAAYRAGDYQKAFKYYADAQKGGTAVETYYNMGNAHFRMGNYTEAIIAYQRALKLSPANDDILHNIEITSNKTVDRLPVETDVFIVKWYKSLVCSLPIDTWAVTALVTLAFSLICYLLYLFMENINVRRISFFSSVVLCLFFLFSVLFAYQQRRYLLTHDTGVVTVEMIGVKSSPTQKSGDAFVIHEGTSVTIADADIKGWYSIRLSDGRQGWVPSSSIELI